MTQWALDTVNRIAAEIRRRRQQMGLSAQALSDRTTELGHTVSRATISDLETGRRGERLLLPDLLALAAALRTSPGLLAFPDQPHGAVDALPKVQASSASAARWMGAGLYLVGSDHKITWPDNTTEQNEVYDSNELWVAGELLDSHLGEVASARTRAARERDMPDDVRDLWLDRLESSRAKAVQSAAKVRELGGTLDEARLAALGVTEDGGNDG